MNNFASSDRRPRVAVVGAGLAGLAAARRLARAGVAAVVFERDERVGGRVWSDRVAGYTIDAGAEFLAHFYRRTASLLDELGLGDELVHIPSSNAVFRAGRWYPIWPDARVLLTHLVAHRDKLALARLAATLVRHAGQLDIHALHKAAQLDQRSVLDYARAYLPPDLLDYVLQPALDGIFAWSPERSSMAIVLLALRAGLSHPSGMRIFTLRGGLARIAEALADRLDLRLATAVRAIEPLPEQRWRVLTADDSQPPLIVDGIVCATTASAVPALLPWLDAERRGFFSAVGYSTAVTIAVSSTVPLPTDYYALLFPHRESAILASVTVQAVKGAGHVPRGHDLLSIHMDGQAARRLWPASDATLRALVLGELQRLASAYTPTATRAIERVYRWREALPEFDPDHFQRLRRFAEGAIEQPGLVFAGDYLGGPFMEGAIVSGEQAAERILKTLFISK